MLKEEQSSFFFLFPNICLLVDVEKIKFSSPENLSSLDDNEVWSESLIIMQLRLSSQENVNSLQTGSAWFCDLTGWGHPWAEVPGKEKGKRGKG